MWGIPTVAVAIMTGIIVAAYQPQLAGLPRLALLSVGSLFLFGLVVEICRKRLHMNVISLLLRDLQKDGLKLDEEFQFPLGLPIDTCNKQDIEDYLAKHPIKEDRLFNKFKSFSARRFLTYVIFVAAVVVALLALTELYRIITEHMILRVSFELR